MRISGNEPSAVILSQTKWLQMWKMMVRKCKTNWSQKEWWFKPTKLQFQSVLIRKILMLLKLYESTEVDRKDIFNKYFN